MKCFNCGSDRMTQQCMDLPVKVGEYAAANSVQVPVCQDCGEYSFSSSQIHDAELKAAIAVLVDKGASGAVFRSVRKILGLKQTELAALLDVSAETISRFECGKQVVQPATRLAVEALTRRVVEHGPEALEPGWTAPGDEKPRLTAA
jgi:DNA-binding XRE family transcriptional regulator